jgi:release factor glutamine methyltransferase
MLGDNGSRLDVELLLGHCLGLTRTALLARSDQRLSPTQLTLFKAMLEQRRAGVPLAYLLNRQAFWTSEFKVTADTLIPRADTELLIATILERCTQPECTLIDLGTGSGAIAVSIAKERPHWTVIGTDQCSRALKVAQDNGRNLSNLFWVQANWLDGFADARFDIIVANPPYIAPDDAHLPALRYEPRQALVAADGGLEDLKTIISQAKGRLTKTGHLLLEHGYNQQSAVIDAMTALDWHSEGLRDLSGNPRAVIGQLGA